MKNTGVIVRTIRAHYPATQTIYLFGTHDTEDEWPDSDVDIAVLLPPGNTRCQPSLMRSPCQCALSEALSRPVDLVNAREVPTVFQKEIIQSGRKLYCGDNNATAEFELLTLSLYQKLNEERKAILDAFQKTGRAYNA